MLIQVQSGLVYQDDPESNESRLSGRVKSSHLMGLV